MPRTNLPKMPRWLTYLVAGGLGLIFVLMPVHAFLSTWGGTAIGPLWLWKSWKEILLLLLAAPVLMWLLLTPVALRQLMRKPLAIALLAYITLSVVLAVVFRQENGQDAMLAGLAMNLRYLGLGALAYLLFVYGQPKEAWLRYAMWYVVVAGVTVAVIGILQVLIVPSDFLSQFGYNKDTTIAPSIVIDDQPHLLRAFATLRGPNDFGAFLILPILIVVAHLRRLPLWVSASMLGFMGVALLLSSSRSAWVGMIVAVLALGAYALGKRLSRVAMLAILAGFVLSIAGLFYAASMVPLLRQAVFHSSPGDSSLTEGSTDKHIAATVHGVARVIEQPLGCGPGCSGPASYYGNHSAISENYFVQIAEEVGVLGILLFCMVVGLMAFKLHAESRNYPFNRVLVSAVLGYAAIGMLLHVWSDDPLSITWWLLAGAAIGYNESNSWTKSKNSLRSKTSSSS